MDNNRPNSRVLVPLKWSPIILVLVLIFVMKITLVQIQKYFCFMHVFCKASSLCNKHMVSYRDPHFGLFGVFGVFCYLQCKIWRHILALRPRFLVCEPNKMPGITYKCIGKANVIKITVMSPRHCTFPAVPRLTQPSTLRGTVNEYWWIPSRENHLCRVAGNTVWSHMTSDLSSALEVCFKRDALNKSMFTLLYFTLLRQVSRTRSDDRWTWCQRLRSRMTWRWEGCRTMNWPMTW